MLVSKLEVGLTSVPPWLALLAPRGLHDSSCLYSRSDENPLTSDDNGCKYTFFLQEYKDSLVLKTENIVNGKHFIVSEKTDEK